MFTIKGAPAYTKAFILTDGQTKRLSRKLGKPDLPLVIHSKTKRTESYPIDLGPTLDGLPGFEPGRPLWLFCVDNQIVLASPTEETAEIEEELPKIFGPNTKIVDVKKAREQVQDITVTNRESALSHSISTDHLTLWQTIQLLSIRNGKIPASVELRFYRSLESRNLELWGRLFYAPLSAQSEVVIPLCDNLTYGISYPISRTDFSRVLFRSNQDLLGTAFELDTGLF